MVDRFENGDPTNDGEIDPADPTAWHGGDVAGLSRRLDWLEALGVETVWTSPLTLGRREPFMGHGAYHGYWVLEHGEPDPHLGTWEELRALSDALRARGMRLYLDAVLNHVSYEAPLTTRQPGWFHGRGAIEDWGDPVQLVEGDVHGLPDLAVEQEEVFAYLAGTLDTWIEKVRPAGLRLDAVKHLPVSFWQRLAAHLHQKHGDDFELLGEDLEGDPFLLAGRWKAAGFDSVFDFPLRYALVDVACNDQGASRLASLLSLDRVYEHPERLTTLLDNHDLARIASECGEPTNIRLALSLLYLLRGTPSLLYGTEVGLKGRTELEVRADMRFEADHPLRAHVAALARQRAAHPALSRGATLILELEARTLLLLRVPREGEGSAVLVGVNVSGAPHTFTTRGAPVALPEATLEVGSWDAGMVALPLAPEALAALREALRMRGTLEAPRQRELTFEARVPGVGEDETVLLCGSDPALGSWRPERAFELEPVGEGVFRGTLSLPEPAVIEWKLLRRRGKTFTWQGGANRSLHLDGGGEDRRQLAW
ncbi:MAG: alpha-amylase family glycosyl hydrolase [Deltaproteobacteria bacterium]|nr:alpha-amylase family glycosyl hydrolase [Deltaproteobacteria bacterium]